MSVQVVTLFVKLRSWFSMHRVSGFRSGHPEVSGWQYVPAWVQLFWYNDIWIVMSVFPDCKTFFSELCHSFMTITHILLRMISFLFIGNLVYNIMYIVSYIKFQPTVCVEADAIHPYTSGSAGNLQQSASWFFYSFLFLCFSLHTCENEISRATQAPGWTAVIPGKRQDFSGSGFQAFSDIRCMDWNIDLFAICLYYGHMLWKGVEQKMYTAKVFQCGNRQAIRIPKEL